jgi:hypothetical protein
LFWLSTQCTPLLFVVHVVIELSAMITCIAWWGMLVRFLEVTWDYACIGLCSQHMVFAASLLVLCLLFSPVFCDVVSLFLTTVYHCSALECFSFSVHGKPPENADGLELIWWLHHNWICCKTIKIFVNMCRKSCTIHFWATEQKWEFTYRCAFYRSTYAHGIWMFC